MVSSDSAGTFSRIVETVGGRSRGEDRLNRSPILKALSSIRKSGARTLLMGGQACMFYGAAEFSRYLDLLVLLEPENMHWLRGALKDLKAELAAVPPLEAAYLKRGHAVHFRCRRDDVAGLRVDLMSSPRGLATFEELWQWRTSIEVNGEPVDLLALEDLVRAKKTQRDKDWPMIRRLVEQSYFTGRRSENTERIAFWLRELRTPELLIDVAKARPLDAQRIAPFREAVRAALDSDVSAVSSALDDEEEDERRKDRLYWEPLRRELEEFRRKKRESPE